MTHDLCVVEVNAKLVELTAQERPLLHPLLADQLSLSGAKFALRSADVAATVDRSR